MATSRKLMRPAHVDTIWKPIEPAQLVGDYEGKEREKWSIYRGGSGDSAKPMEKKGIKALDAKFKALL